MINDSGDGFKVGRSAEMLKALSQDFYEYYDRVKVSVRNKGNTYGEFLRSPNGAQGDLLWSGSLGKNEMLGMGSYVELEPRSYEEMFGGVENLTNDRLYGTQLDVEYELFDGSQSLGTVTEPFHVYRWVDAQTKFEYLPDSLGQNILTKEIEIFVPKSSYTTFKRSKSEFKYPGLFQGNQTTKFYFVPERDEDITWIGEDSFTIEVDESLEIGRVILSAQAQRPSCIDPDVWENLKAEALADPEKMQELCARILDDIVQGCIGELKWRSEEMLEDRQNLHRDRYDRELGSNTWQGHQDIYNNTARLLGDIYDFIAKHCPMLFNDFDNLDVLEEAERWANFPAPEKPRDKFEIDPTLQKIINFIKGVLGLLRGLVIIISHLPWLLNEIRKFLSDNPVTSQYLKELSQGINSVTLAENIIALDSELANNPIALDIMEKMIQLANQ